MKVLVIDRDELVADRVKNQLVMLGHSVYQETVKNNAVSRLGSESFDIILVDPSPLSAPRPLILSIRRSLKSYAYVLLMSGTLPLEEAMKSGVNDLLSKPFENALCAKKIDNAVFMVELIQRIGDDSEDFPSAGGVIAKSAFNQLFLSGMDRADRYGERTYILFITLSNYNDIRSLDGPYAAEYMVAKLCQYLVLLRRQSDIIGQTARYEYALLLQRPLYENEPVEAAGRFAEALSKFEDLDVTRHSGAEITVSLVELPTGARILQHKIKPGESIETL